MPNTTNQPTSDIDQMPDQLKSGKVGRIIALIAIIAVVLGAIIASVYNRPSNFDQVWDPATTVGSPDAKNYFVVYSDLACPYCIAFENAVVENEEAFHEYLEENDILYEVRLSDFLYEYGESNPEHSRFGAVGTFCAKNEGKFWEYYDHAITRVWNDFFKDNGKSGASALAQKGKEYWVELGRDVGLGDTFASCVENEDPLPEVQENAEKSIKTAQGMPYFKFNDFVQSGFDMNGDWNDVLAFFQAGLESR